MKYLLVGILALGAAGCGGSTTSPADASVSGTWVGAIGTSLGTESLVIPMVQSGSTVSGIWSALYQSTPVISYSGQLSGTKTGASLAVTLTPSIASECSYTYNATLSGATVMAGTFTSFACPSPTTDSGTLTLTKQ